MLRALFRSAVTRPKINIFRFASSETSNSAEASAQADQPIEIPNPFEREKVKCILCKHGIEPDYKNIRLIAQFQSQHTGKIYGRHITGLCKKMQAKVEAEFLKAQHLAFMGNYNKNVSFLKDPKLYDPERPIRPHKY